MATDVGSATGYLDLDISGFLAGLQSAQSAADKQTKNMAQKIGKNMSDAGEKITKVGTSLTKFVTTPIVGAGAAIIKTSANFESAMSKVSAISGATGDELVDLSDKAKEMGAKTKFSATEAAEAFTYMAMAGWDTEKMLAGIDGIMNLAAADGLDLATTSDIVTDALTAFGMSADEAGTFADTLAAASSNANTNVSMLGESFKYVAPVAGSLGYTAKDTAIALGLMANAGIKGSQSGTALRASLTRMISPSKEAAAMMKQYNLSLTNSDGTMKSLGDVMVMLRDNLGDLTEAQQAEVAATIFGQEAMSGMLAIINAADKDFEDLTNNIYNSKDAAEEMATTMNDNLAGKLTLLKSQLEGVALQLGEVLMPHISNFVSWISSLVEKFAALDTETQATIVKIAALAAVIGPAILIVGKLTSALGGIFTAFGNIASKFGKAKAAVEGVGKAAGGAAGGVGKGAASFGNLAGQGVKLVAAGVSFLMVAAGIKMIADAAISVASAGPGAAAAFVLLAAGGVGLAAALVAIGGSATATAAGLLALGGSVALVTGGVALLVAAIGDATSKVLNAFANVVESVGSAALDAGDGFEKLAKSIMNLVNNTGALDLAATLGAVATGIDKINASAAGSAQASQSVTAFSQAFTTAFSVKIKSAINDFSTNMNNASTKLNVSMTQMSTSVRTMSTNAKTDLTVFENAFKTSVGNVKASIEDLKTTIANTKFEFNQKIKLPHFSMSGKFDAQTGSVPSVSVSWYKSAMSGGIILDAATIFGFDPRTGKFLGAGEAGSETVVGTKSLLKMIRNSVAEAVGPMVEVMFQLTRASYELGYITNNAFARQAQAYEQVIRSRGDGSSSGDTYNFYSPKALDEIEAARQMKIAKRDMAEGF